eukprot:12923188-Prorocentrum_lima.AAC.1
MSWAWLAWRGLLPYPHVATWGLFRRGRWSCPITGSRPWALPGIVFCTATHETCSGMIILTLPPKWAALISVESCTCLLSNSFHSSSNGNG